MNSPKEKAFTYPNGVSKDIYMKDISSYLNNGWKIQSQCAIGNFGEELYIKIILVEENFTEK